MPLHIQGTLVTLGILFAVTNAGLPAPGILHLRQSGDRLELKVDGDNDEDWWIETSSDLTTWTTATNLSPLFLGTKPTHPGDW